MSALRVDAVYIALAVFIVFLRQALKKFKLQAGLDLTV